MTRLALLPLAALVWGTALTAAPVPKEAKKADQFPTAVGTRREYIRAGNDKKSWVEEVTEREEKDGTVTFKVEVTTTRGTKQWARYRVRDGGLALLGEGVAGSEGEDSPSPHVLYDTTWTPGEPLTQTFTYDKAEYEEVVSVGKAEEVTTPAGKFTAVPVTRTSMKPVRGNGTTYWYADGVGMVRACHIGEKTPLMELKSFTPGGNKK